MIPTTEDTDTITWSHAVRKLERRFPFQFPQHLPYEASMFLERKRQAGEISLVDDCDELTITRTDFDKMIADLSRYPLPLAAATAEVRKRLNAAIADRLTEKALSSAVKRGQVRHSGPSDSWRFSLADVTEITWALAMAKYPVE